MATTPRGDCKGVVVAGLRALQAAADGNAFKRRAYAAALAKVVALQGALVDAEQLRGHLTPTMLDKVAGMMAAAGSCDTPEAGRHAAAADVERAVVELQGVTGIGPAAARALAEQHGVRSVQQLLGDGALAARLLNAKQLLGLRHHADSLERIPRAEMDKHAALVARHAAAVGLRADAVGSYRRGAASSGDFDALVTWDPAAPGMTRARAEAAFSELLDALRGAKYLGAEPLARGRAKFMGYARLPRHKRWRRVDLLLTPPEEHAFALLYFTGPKEFNVRVRAAAQRQGLRLNEHGLYDAATGARVPGAFGDEASVLARLGLPYADPGRRARSAAA